MLLFEYHNLLNLYLAVFKPVGFDVQEFPSYSSVAPVLLLVFRHQMLNLLFVFQLLLKLVLLYLNLIRFDVQLFPSYSSVAAVLGGSTTKS
jgi:hypothetical protein